MCDHIGIREFNFCPNCGIKLNAPINKFIGDCVDIEGNAYKTMLFGDQEWMIEDLKTTKYNDGTPIKIVECGKCWSNLKTPAMCYYNNDSLKNILYNWYAVDTGKLAPKGWHIPTHEEWTKAEKYIKKNHRLFNALPGGYRNVDGNFYIQSDGGHWWSATEYDASNAWNRHLYDRDEYLYRDGYLYRDYDNKSCGFSLRLARD